MTATPTPTPITRVLVANRGEIARRVFTTCRARGISTVAVFSDPDADAAFVAEADAGVRLPGTTAAQTYLRGDLIIDAARKSGADAIHPGYGFLSENADFARDVIAAGLVWIGPDPESIDVMGSKVESKQMMADAGVPVLEKLDPETITADQLPVLVKASSGGGGRGMREVYELADLTQTVEAASREAASAFGDPTVFCERYIPSGHHIEVQVFGDRHGNVWAVGERECSIQRRHQKVVEEAPAPLVERIGEEMRERLYTAARNAAQAIGYVGAGTVEFLADDDGSFFFLEMNTRLQVEHPVTECTVGVDLVGLQIDIAAGEPLEGEPPAAHGHAIEVRLYAEDPAHDWQPQSGPVSAFDMPEARYHFTIPPFGTAAVRLDSGIEAGEAITTFYDPMIAKVIGVAPERAAAARVLAAALDSTEWVGPVTNANMLAAVLREDDFLAGQTATTYFDEHPQVLGAGEVGEAEYAELYAAAVAAAVGAAAAIGAGAASGPADRIAITDASGSAPADPTDAEAALALALAADNPRPRIGGFRCFHTDWRTRSFTTGDSEFTVRYRHERDGWTIDPDSVPGDHEVKVVRARPDQVRLNVDGVESRYRVSRTSAAGIDSTLVSTPLMSVALADAPRYTDPSDVVTPGSLLAPMPGTVIRVEAAVGDEVKAGQLLISMEAMKMEHTIRADVDGILEELRVAAGDQVDAGSLIAVITADETEGGDPA